jgi:WD40 repeat protein
VAALCSPQQWRRRGVVVAGGGWSDLTRAHTGGLHAAVFSPNTQLLATASIDCTVKLWNASAYRRAPINPTFTADTLPRQRPTTISFEEQGFAIFSIVSSFDFVPLILVAHQRRLIVSSSFVFVVLLRIALRLVCVRFCIASVCSC